MTIQYLVASPGRSGSIFACSVVARAMHLYPIYGNWRNLPLVRPSVLHSHEAKLQLNPDVKVIQVHRRNVFAQIISAMIAEEYNQWSNYDATNKKPFVANIDQFFDKYIWHKKWHQAFEHYTQYKNVQHVWFEDFIGNAEKLCTLLNIPQTSNLPHSKKSPFGEHYISNIERLKKEFNHLENDTSLQQSAVEKFNWDDLKLQ